MMVLHRGRVDLPVGIEFFEYGRAYWASALLAFERVRFKAGFFPTALLAFARGFFTG